MKKNILFILIFLLTGCVSGHYYDVDHIENGTLRIVLDGVEAKAVYFASSLDSYQLHVTERIDDNSWAIRVPADKTFKYFYIVDGVVYIPPCIMREADDFGSGNCIYIPGM